MKQILLSLVMISMFGVAGDVHASTLATLKSYSRVISVKEWTGN